MSDFFRKLCLILSEVFWYMEKEQESIKKFITVQKKFIFLRVFDRRNTIVRK